jgi:hypothetical protein
MHNAIGRHIYTSWDRLCGGFIFFINIFDDQKKKKKMLLVYREISVVSHEREEDEM